MFRLIHIALSFFFLFSALAQRQELIPQGLGTERIASERGFVKRFAEENGWEAPGKSGVPYLTTEMTVTARDGGTFRLCRLSNGSLPSGGVQTLILFQANRLGRFVFAPLATQYPPNPDYSMTIKPGTIRLIRPQQGPGRILWIEIHHQVKERSGDGDTLSVAQQLFGYAFAVGPRTPMRCLAYNIPLRMARTVNGTLQQSDTLEVRFPSRHQIQIVKRSATVAPQQEKWIGVFNTEE